VESTPPPSSVLPLEYSKIWEAEGLHTLPFSGCGDRIFRFYGHSTPTSLQSLKIYRKLRESAPPERWSDLDGNRVAFGHVISPDHSQVNIGLALAGRLGELQSGYILIRKAKLARSFHDKVVSAHLDGDSVYQWVAYPSLGHAQMGLVESLSLGYSVVGAWAELDVSEVGTAGLGCFAGMEFVVESRKIFAAVGFKE